MTAIVPVNGLQLTVTGTTAVPVKVGIRRCRPGLSVVVPVNGFVLSCATGLLGAGAPVASRTIQ